MAVHFFKLKTQQNMNTSTKKKTYQCDYLLAAPPRLQERAHAEAAVLLKRRGASASHHLHELLS